MNNIPITEFYLFILLICSASCAQSGGRVVQGVLISQSPSLPPLSKIEKGVIYEMPIHSDEGWCYYSKRSPIRVGWSLLRRHNEEGDDCARVELDEIKNNIAEWVKSSQAVNGWPTVSNFIGTLSIGGEIPVYEWKTLANSVDEFDYISIMPILGSHSNVQIRVTSSDETKMQLSFEQVSAVLRELTESMQWKQLYITIQKSNTPLSRL